MPITDYHKLIRDAVADTLRAEATGVEVATVDEITDVSKQSLPVIAVACVGPEQNRGEMGTNCSDGIGFPVAVMLLASGTAHGEKSPEVLELTAFRRILRTLFHHKRLSGVSQVGWCEVSDSGPLLDPKEPAFQKVSTAMVVLAVGRFPRS
jgi:hypothetical protein